MFGEMDSDDDCPSCHLCGASCGIGPPGLVHSEDCSVGLAETRKDWKAGPWVYDDGKPSNDQPRPPSKFDPFAEMEPLYGTNSTMKTLIKAFGGKWDKAVKLWFIPKRHEARVKELLAEQRWHQEEEEPSDFDLDFFDVHGDW